MENGFRLFIMIKKSFVYKLLLGLVFISLILPIKAPAALAQAKLCCKIFCSHMMRTATAHDHEHDRAPLKNCGANEVAAVDCCQDNCPRILGQERSTMAPAVNFPSAALLPVKFSSAVPFANMPDAFLSRNYPATHCAYLDKTKALPLFLTHAIFLI